MKLCPGKSNEVGRNNFKREENGYKNGKKITNENDKLNKSTVRTYNEHKRSEDNNISTCYNKKSDLIRTKYNVTESTNPYVRTVKKVSWADVVKG